MAYKKRKPFKRKSLPAKDVKVRVIPPISFMEERRLAARSSKSARWGRDKAAIQDYYKIQDR